MFLDDIEKIEDEKDFKELIEYSIFLINEIRNYAKKNGFLNEQYYLDWEDELNRISVMDPTK